MMKNLNPLLLTAILSLPFAVGPGAACAQNPGSLDVSFDPGLGANSYVWATAIQSDGKIIVGGWFSGYNGTPRNRIARLNSDGSLDATFDPGAGADWNVMAIAIQSDGKIVIGGFFSFYNGTPRHGIARLNTDGSLDATFDPGAGVSGGAPETVVTTIAIQSDGKILIGGVFYFYNGTPVDNIARLNEDGGLDATFGGGGGFGILAIAIQNDGKIMIGGTFTNRIARLNVDGSLDATFDLGTGVGGPSVDAISIQGDGRIVIGGSFWSYNGTPRNNIARLNVDGTLDMTFDPGGGADGVVYSTAIQSDGRILIGGSFTSHNGTPRNRIARTDADGSLDMTFDPGGGANGVVYSIAIQSDGRILIGGGFSSYNGTPRNRIARLNWEGTVDVDAVATNDFAIFPNPASTSVTLALPEHYGCTSLLLLNALGQQVIRTTVVAGPNEVPLTGLTPGLYSVHLGGSGVQRTQWLMLE